MTTQTQSPDPRGPSPEPAPSFRVTAQLSFPKAAASNKGSKKARGATANASPGPKTKEFTFPFDPTIDAYITLLNTILQKHDQDQHFKATERRTYGIKVLLSPARAKGDAVDIEKLEEYQEIAEKIQEKEPNKVTIYVEMSQIQKGAKKLKGRPSEDDEDDSEDDEDGDEQDEGAEKFSGSAYEYELARFRRMLEKKYKNDHDGGYTYINRVTGQELPLTPAMMKEWARACWEGEATTKQPPNSEAFDFSKRAAVLNPARRQPGAVSGGPASAPATDLSSVAEIFQSVTRLLEVSNGSKTPVPPATPSRPATQDGSAASSPQPAIAAATPTALKRFLRDAELQMGITNAPTWRYSLEEEGYGPDVISRVDNAKLESLGISAGDVIRLKDASAQWWREDSKKRKRSDSAAGNSTPQAAHPVTPPQRRVRFRTNFPEGGYMTWFGPRIEPGESDPMVQYFCVARQGWHTLPPGFVGIPEADEHPISAWD